MDNGTCAIVFYRARLLFRERAYLHNASAADIKLSELGHHLKNQTICLFDLQPPVAHAGVEDRPIYAPAYRTVACPSDMKLARGARRRMRTVSWCHVREREQQAREETAF
jgi:hypothetical protein